jgi:hypothetical protein
MFLWYDDDDDDDDDGSYHDDDDDNDDDDDESDHDNYDDLFHYFYQIFLFLYIICIYDITFLYLSHIYIG